MITGVLTALAFVLTLAIEQGAIRSLPAPLGLFPLMLVCGVLVMHRGDLFLGVCWFVAMAIIVHPWGNGAVAVAPLLVAAVAALPLQQKIFTNRSVYALLGLGASLFFVMTLTAFIIAGVHGVWSDESWLTEHFLRDRAIEAVELLVGLYVGVDLVRRLGTWAKKTFFLHH